MKGRAQGCLMAATGKNGNEGMLFVCRLIYSCINICNNYYLSLPLQHLLKENNIVLIEIIVETEAILHKKLLKSMEWN